MLHYHNASTVRGNIANGCRSEREQIVKKTNIRWKTSDCRGCQWHSLDKLPHFAGQQAKIISTFPLKWDEMRSSQKGEICQQPEQIFWNTSKLHLVAVLNYSGDLSNVLHTLHGTYQLRTEAWVFMVIILQEQENQIRSPFFSFYSIFKACYMYFPVI